MLYVTRAGDVTGSRRGERAVEWQPSAAIQQSLKGGCREQGPGSSLTGARGRGARGSGSEGPCRVGVDQPDTVRSSHTGAEWKGGNSTCPVGSSGAAVPGASTPFFHMRPPIARCGSAGRAMGLLSLLIALLPQSPGPSVSGLVYLFPQQLWAEKRGHPRSACPPHPRGAYF